VATPLSLADVIAGEILWAASKGFVVSLIMLAVIAPFGVLAWPQTLVVLPLAALGGLLFAAIGMCFTAVCPTIDTINLPLFLFVWPMFLFSGTFFPLDQIPEWARPLAAALPLTWLARACRAATLGALSGEHLVDGALLLVTAAVLFALAQALMRRRLVR
jgi:lipooligosaccharide transport system permease protein